MKENTASNVEGGLTPVGMTAGRISKNQEKVADWLNNSYLYKDLPAGLVSHNF